jgi:hypothetical protein
MPSFAQLFDRGNDLGGRPQRTADHPECEQVEHQHGHRGQGQELAYAAPLALHETGIVRFHPQSSHRKTKNLDLSAQRQVALPDCLESVCDKFRHLRRG